MDKTMLATQVITLLSFIVGIVIIIFVVIILFEVIDLVTSCETLEENTVIKKLAELIKV